MGRREITEYYDDIDQTPLKESELHVVEFSIDGRDYVLDLSRVNLQRFHDTLRPFLTAAREVPDDEREDPSEVRQWARNQGMDIAHRGKIPFAIVDAYRKAHA